MRVDRVSRAEAVRRLAAQPEQAATAKRLAAQFGPDRTAGAWVDRSTGELVVTVLDDQAADAVRAAGARPQRVRYPATTLASVVRHLDAAGDMSGVQSWGVDAKSNAVVVRLAGAATPQAAASTDDVVRRIADRFGPAVQFRQGAGPFTRTQNVHPGFTLTRSGSEACTSGYSAEDPATGSQVMITAAHCVPTGNAAIDSFAFGTTLKANAGRDIAAVRNNFPAFWQLRPQVWGYHLGFLTVTGMFDAVQFQLVCKSGNRTGITCGFVLGTGVTQPPPTGGGQQLTNLTVTDMCAKVGDSGGPVISINPIIAGRASIAGTHSSALLYDSKGNIWKSPAQGQDFCGTEVPPQFGGPKEQLEIFQPATQNLAIFHLDLMTG